MSIMNMESYKTVGVYMVLATAPLTGGGCQMVSQNTEPACKVATQIPPPYIEREIKIHRPSNDYYDLNTVMLKSMKIAEEKANQNDTSAQYHAAELQKIVEQYFRHNTD